MISKIVSIVFLVASLTGCATTKYGWMPAPEKTEEQALRDQAGCDSAAMAGIRGGRQVDVVAERDLYAASCMKSHGHKLVEIE